MTFSHSGVVLLAIPSLHAGILDATNPTIHHCNGVVSQEGVEHWCLIATIQRPWEATGSLTSITTPTRTGHSADTALPRTLHLFPLYRREVVRLWLQMEYELGGVRHGLSLAARLSTPKAARQVMSTPHPAPVPPRGQAKRTSQGNQNLHLSCCQLYLSYISTANLMAQGQPGMLPSGLKAELMPICGAESPPKTAEG